MACLLYTLMILSVAGSLCGGVPIKPKSLGEGATDDCYGTQCYYYDTDYTDTNVQVTFPENFTDAILLALPNIQGSQNEMVMFLNKTLSSQDKEAGMLESHLENIQGSQNEMVMFMNKTIITQDKIVGTLENVETLIEAGLQGINQQIKNMTTIMSVLLVNVADLLTTQSSILKARLQPIATDCQDIAVQGRSKNGSYVITPPDGLVPFEVYCDFTDNEGWTVFQKRFDGSVDFYQTWTLYEQGFGDANGEYWLGLTNIRRLLSDGTWVLQIDLESFDGENAYARYDTFGISDAASNYRLSVGEYSGNAGDSLKYTGESGNKMHNGMAFSTYDRDNDGSSDDCASRYKAGWWYKACYRANLNGLFHGPDGNYWSGMIWYSWKRKQSLKSTQMKIRRVQ